jgi:hypothetical protein
MPDTGPNRFPADLLVALDHSSWPCHARSWPRPTGSSRPRDTSRPAADRAPGSGRRTPATARSTLRAAVARPLLSERVGYGGLRQSTLEHDIETLATELHAAPELP